MKNEKQIINELPEPVFVLEEFEDAVYKPAEEGFKVVILRQDCLSFYQKRMGTVKYKACNVALKPILWQHAIKTVLDTFKFTPDLGTIEEIRNIIPKRYELLDTNDKCGEVILNITKLLLNNGVEMELNDSTKQKEGKYFPSKVASVVGELVCAWLWRNRLFDISSFDNPKYHYDLDLLVGGKVLRVDVKTKIRLNSKLYYYYEATAPQYQFIDPNKPLDYIVYVNIPDWDTAQVLGVVDKDALKNAILIKKGTQMWNCNKKYRYNCYSFQCCYLPSWKNTNDVCCFYPTCFPPKPELFSAKIPDICISETK